ncbi:uncharacterized protein LOC114576365 [Exaiptasia diaphana]|uniref:Uncharacterized protein n=1 Tax=Exaiptasia diaphana TaxID=2652724 RepID=A0A913YX97_EXADI|nr:uncharacterized protein LOC114576365 [Exaiptasia diaphana]
MQFWYMADARSSIKVCRTNKSNSTICLWSSPNTTNKEWTFGQVEISGYEGGNVIIVGNAVGDSPGLDDLTFIETPCSQVISQSNPSCYFDVLQPCPMNIDKSWLLTTYKDQQGANSFYLNLDFPSNSSNKISSQAFSTLSHGWKCLRFWMSSPSKYSSKKLDVIYKSENNTISGISFTSVTPGWVYLQSPIPREENNLKVNKA